MVYEKIIVVIAIVSALVLHEVAHGLVALWCGDTTARDQNRLSLNPLRHIDPFGSIILPFILTIVGGASFGWAKPVPINLSKCRNPMRAIWLTAAAGPLCNLLQAVVYALILCFQINYCKTRMFTESEIQIQNIIHSFISCSIIVNISLACFNMIPIPPLDGSKVLSAILPGELKWKYLQLERFGFIILFLVLSSSTLGACISQITNWVLTNFCALFGLRYG